MITRVYLVIARGRVGTRKLGETSFTIAVRTWLPRGRAVLTEIAKIKAKDLFRYEYELSEETPVQLYLMELKKQ